MCNRDFNSFLLKLIESRGEKTVIAERLTERSILGIPMYKIRDRVAVELRSDASPQEAPRSNVEPVTTKADGEFHPIDPPKRFLPKFGDWLGSAAVKIGLEKFVQFCSTYWDKILFVVYTIWGVSPFG